MRAGMYQIRNNATGAVYFGSSIDLDRRFRQHREELTGKRHFNARLQRSWNKYGRAAFSFDVLAILEPRELVSTETRLLRKVVGTEGCLNVAIDSQHGMRGRHHSEETKAKIRTALAGRPLGRIVVITEEQKARIAATLKGRRLSATHRKNVSDGMRGRKDTAETRERKRVASTGRRHSPETRAKMSAAKKGRQVPREVIERLASINRGRKHRPETIQRMQEFARSRKRDAEGVFV